MPEQTWYTSMTEDQPPFEDVADDVHRVFKFNVSVHKVASATFEEEIAAFIEQEFPAYAPVYIGAKASVPDGEGPYVTVIGYGGMSALRSQNSNAPFLERPSAQIVVRAKKLATAKSAAYHIHRRLSSVINQFLVVPDWATQAAQEAERYGRSVVARNSHLPPSGSRMGANRRDR